MAKKGSKIWEVHIFAPSGILAFFGESLYGENEELCIIGLKNMRRKVKIGEGDQYTVVRDGSARWVGMGYETRQISPPDWWNKK